MEKSYKNRVVFFLFCRLKKVPVFILIVVLICNCQSVSAQSLNNDINNTTINKKSTTYFSNIITLSKDISTDMSKLVGVSISPLLGIGALGAYGYFQEPMQQRNQLPWFNSPKFWIPILIFLIIITSKDFITTTFPFLHFLNKPLDAVENFENIISAIVAMPIIITLLNDANTELFSIVSSCLKDLNISIPANDQFVEAGILQGLKTASFIVVGCISFILVWLASHSINVLILLSPFGFIDLILRVFRFSIIGILVISSVIHPFLGLLFCILLIFIAYRISGWSFRLLVFGTIFSYDILSRKHKKNKINSEKILAFSGKSIHKIPTRTYGYLKRNEDNSIEFIFKPWLIKPARSIVISEASINFEIGKGLVYPVILESNTKSNKIHFRLPPRYRSHEIELNDVLGIKTLREIGMLKGLRAMRQWVNDNVIIKRKQYINNISKSYD